MSGRRFAAGAALALAAGCAPARSPATAKPIAGASGGDEQTGPFRPAPQYAALFEEGRVWIYTVTRAATHFDTPDGHWIVDTPSTVEVSCRVAAVGRWSGGVAGRIECDAEMPMWIAATRVATAKGLYLLVDVAPFPDGAPPLEDDVFLELAAHPKESSNDDPGEEGSMYDSVEREGQAWCVMSGFTTIGESTSDRRCFDAAGITSGQSNTENDETGTVTTTFRLKQPVSPA